MAFKKCGHKSLVRDDVTGMLACDQCGIILERDNFDPQIFCSTGYEGTFSKIGTSGAGFQYSYKETKIYKAENLISELMSKLQVTNSSKVTEVKNMIRQITADEFGQGDWFTVLVGACAYIIMRRDGKSLSLEEVAHVVGCDIYELGKMIKRVINFLNLKQDLPQFDIVAAFEQVVNTLPNLKRLDKDMVETIRKQGIFLIQCAIKWYLTTGRKPLPLVAAVLVFIAEMNKVDLTIEDVANKIHATVSTTKLRYKELLEALVKVAQNLPWGKDVTVKNVLKNAPFIMEYMEMKSMMKPCKKKETSEDDMFDVEEVVSEFLRGNVEHVTDMAVMDDDSQYFLVENNMAPLEVSPESLRLLYTKFLDEMKSIGQGHNVGSNKGGKKLELNACREWWDGKSELNKRILLKHILEKDVGLDAMPPSFVKGQGAYKRRRVKINAAKMRIKNVMQPQSPVPNGADDICILECSDAGKKRKRRDVIDWEDFVIETLLLHRVNEDEIMKGHYNTLLDLHVFHSGILNGSCSCNIFWSMDINWSRVILAGDSKILIDGLKDHIADGMDNSQLNTRCESLS